MPPAKQLLPELACPCGSTTTLGNCCLPYINRTTRAPTAEALMRSRYTAHVLVEIDYLWDTWSPEVRIRSSKDEITDWATSCKWLGLKIIKTEAGGEQDTYGMVSFIALFKQHETLQQHAEVSEFKKNQFGWLYLKNKE